MPARGRPAKTGNSQAVGDDKKPVRKQKPLFKREESFQNSIFKVLKQVHPEVGISKAAMNTMNSIILEFYRTVAKEAQAMNQKTGKRTMTAQDI